MNIAAIPFSDGIGIDSVKEHAREKNRRKGQKRMLCSIVQHFTANHRK